MLAVDRPGLMRSLPQRRRANFLRIPIPGIRKSVFRIEFQVVVDSVFGRRDAGQQRRVAGVGDRRPHAGYAAGIRTLAHQAAQKRDLEAVRIRIQDVFRFQPIDRNHEHGSGGLRARRPQARIVGAAPSLSARSKRGGESLEEYHSLVGMM